MIGLPSLQALDRAQVARIWMASEATDMRCGFDRLAERVEFRPQSPSCSRSASSRAPLCVEHGLLPRPRLFEATLDACAWLAYAASRPGRAPQSNCAPTRRQPQGLTGALLPRICTSGRSMPRSYLRGGSGIGAFRVAISFDSGEERRRFEAGSSYSSQRQNDSVIFLGGKRCFEEDLTL